MQGRFARARWALLGATFAVLVGGMAYAAIPHSGTGVITGCYAKSDGTLRVIDAQSGKSCKGTEKKLTWNQKGPRGPRGPAGVVGNLGDLDGKPCTTSDGTGTVQLVEGQKISADGFHSRSIGLQCRVPFSTADVDEDGFSEADGDCDDDDASIHPGATEVLNNNVDEDCDGLIQSDCDDGSDYTIDTDNGDGSCEHVLQAIDADGDGHTATQASGGSPDCDDTDNQISPTAPEIALNGKDDDCDGIADEDDGTP